MTALSHEVRAADAAAICDRLFGKFATTDSPGVVVGVTHRGKLLHRGCYGMADLAQGTPLDEQSVIRIGSQTKQFTVLLALMLEAEGKLSMADEVHRYMPWLPKLPHKVTLQHLATNTGGMRDFLEAMNYSGASITSQSTREFARRVIARQNELNFTPGEALIYCNTGFFLLSEIIEEVSGKNFNELLEERICGPLGMADTRLMPRDSDILPRLVAHHSRDGDGSWTRATWGISLGGEGGMVSTLDDMLAWQANFAQPKVGSRALFDRMATPPAYANGAISPYAMGLVAGDYHGLRVVGHGGGVAGGRSESQRYPDAEFGVVILGNLDELAPYSAARRIADACLGGAMRSRRKVEDLAPMAAQAGLYRMAGGDEIFEIRVRDGEPVFSGGMGAQAFDMTAPGRFEPEYGAAHYVLSIAGEGEIAAAWCGHKRVYRRLPATPAKASVSPVGRYEHSGLGMRAEIAEEGADGLVYRMTSPFGVATMVLTQVDHDLYQGRPGPATPPAPVNRDWTFALTFDAAGVTLNNDRTRGLRFARKA